MDSLCAGVFRVRATSLMSLDHNRVPAGSQCHFKLALMMQENVSPSSCTGLQPEGCKEGQMCVFVIRGAEEEGGGTERDIICPAITAKITMNQSRALVIFHKNVRILFEKEGQRASYA